MRNSDRPITRSIIIEQVWDIHFDSVSNVVEVHVNSLRNKIDRGMGCGADSYHPRRRLHAVRQTDVRPLTLRTTLSLSYAAILALLLTGLGSWLLSAAGAAARTRRHGRARGGDERHCTAISDFDGRMPSLVYDRNDSEEVAFIEKATRYYQIYDASSGRLLLQSPALEPLGLHYIPSEVQAFRDARAFTNADRSGEAPPLQQCAHADTWRGLSAPGWRIARSS